MPEIDTTNALAVFLLMLGMFAAVRAAMHTRTGAAENAEDDPSSDEANSAVSPRE